MVFEIPKTIQPREHSMGSGLDGAPYTTNSDGNLNVFAVNHDSDDLWLNTYWSNPRNSWNPDNSFVFVLGYSLYFSPNFLLGEFCFWIWPIHPPSIRPISSKCWERMIYFLVLRTFISQSITRRTFNVSVFRMARRT